MIMFDDYNTAITHPSAQARASLRDLASLRAADTPAGGAAAQHAAAQTRLLLAKENCNLALDNIQMAEMVVNFLEHLLEVKAGKNLAAQELAATRATIASARADVATTHQGFRQACKAFHAAHQNAFPAHSQVAGPAVATQQESAQAT